MYNIPNSIKLLGKNIPIVCLDSVEFARVTKLDADDFGCYCSESEKIFINSAYDAEKQFNTLTHEILHALLRLSCHNEGLTEETEERLVLFIEKFYVPLIIKLTSDTKSNT
jgi:hypothetical protein